MAHVASYETLLRAQTDERRSFRSSILLLAVMSFFGIALWWAATTELDEVTRGQGRVIPSQQLQALVSLETGVLREVLARRGDVVEAGQVLMVMSRTESEGELNQIRQRQLAGMAAAARLEAEIAGADEVLFAPDVLAEAADLARGEAQLFQGRRAALMGELRILEQQRIQREAELGEARADLTAAREGLSLTNDELAMIEPMVRRGIEPQLSLIKLQRSASELQGREAAAAIKIDRLGSALAEVAEKRGAAIEGYRNEALEQLTKVGAQLSEIGQAMPAQAERVARTEIRSPVRGTVNRVHATTQGGAVMAGAPLIDIVPLDDRLLVEGHIKPDDIAFLRPGVPVTVKLTAYDFARYGGLTGRVATIGADAVEMPETGERMFPIQVEVESTLYDGDGMPLAISPGMVADLDVLMGRRTVLDYLIQPVVKVRDAALRER